jgi:hypothetical protein
MAMVVRGREVTGDWGELHGEELIRCVPTSITYLTEIMIIITNNLLYLR